MTIFSGTEAYDFHLGTDGADTVYGNGGDDELHGQSGEDTLFGGEGDDDMFGGLGVDHLYGEEGDDDLYGGIVGMSSLAAAATTTSMATTATTISGVAEARTSCSAAMGSTWPPIPTASSESRSTSAPGRRPAAPRMATTCKASKSSAGRLCRDILDRLVRASTSCSARMATTSWTGGRAPTGSRAASAPIRQAMPRALPAWRWTSPLVSARVGTPRATP